MELCQPAQMQLEDIHDQTLGKRKSGILWTKQWEKSTKNQAVPHLEEETREKYNT